MNKKILIFTSIITMMFLFIGCAKCISKEYENVEVNIVDEYYKPMWLQPVKSGKITTFITHPAKYRITVEYNNIEYTINDNATYNKYKDKVGHTTIGTLEIRNYDDGSTRYNIISLE